MEHQKNCDQEIKGLIQMDNSLEAIINSLVYANDYGELKKTCKSQGNFHHLSGKRTKAELGK